MTLQAIRENKDITQKELANKTGISLSSIRAFEQGQRNINGASIDKLIKICNVLECTISDILDNKEVKTMVIQYENDICNK